jgi:hypothetical protein
MSIALQELESFTHFAQQKLSKGESNLSLEDCVRLWPQQTERDADETRLASSRASDILSSWRRTRLRKLCND